MITTHTLEGAQALLPEARQRISQAALMLGDLQDLVQLHREGRAPPSSDEDIAALEAELAAAMAWFADRGIQVKGVDPALLDFPARATRDGESIDILLCWRGDEDAIAYYHLPSSGYRGREPIAMLDQA